VKKNESDPDYYKLAFNIPLPLGEHFQIQDDYSTMPGRQNSRQDQQTSRTTSARGASILHSRKRLRCSERSYTPTTVARTSEAEAHVKHVFREASVDEQCAQYEVGVHACIDTRIDAVPEVKSLCGEAVLRCSVFHVFLEDFYKRTK